MIDDEWLDISIAGDLYIGVEDRIEIDERLSRQLSGRDLTCINLESPICKEGQKINKIGPNCCQSAEAVKVLKQLGCHLVTLANNHIMDYGMAGLMDTMDCLQREDIAFIGAGTDRKDIYKSYIIEKSGMKVGIINAAENGFGCLDDFIALNTVGGGYAWIFSRYVKIEIQRLKDMEKCDWIIGIFHAGAEDVHVPLPEWRMAYRDFIDMGMDLVAAHHPHVPQGFESYAGKRIYYSLGNFMWRNRGKREQSAKDSREGKFGLILNLHIEKNKEIEDDLAYIREDGKVMGEEENNKAEAWMDQWNQILKEENCREYCCKTAEMCYNLYENLYKQYIKETVGILQSKKAGKFTRLKHYLLNVKRAFFADYEINEDMLFHNIQIETHRWVCMNAVRGSEFWMPDGSLYNYFDARRKQ